MKLEQLQHIIEIEKQKSISKAAKALYIGQPTLSGSLTSLEEEIGVTLFERTHTGVVTTEAGKEAVYLAKQALEAADGIRNLGRKNEGLAGTVTVLLATVYNYLYHEIVSRFRKQYPQAELRLRVRSHDDLVGDLLEGKADIGLLPVAESMTVMLRAQLKQKDYDVQTFDHYAVEAFAGPDSGYAGHKEISLQELRKEQLLASFAEWKEIVEKEIMPEQPVLVVADNESMKQMVCRGEGIALFPALYENQAFHCAVGDIQVMRLAEGSFLELENCLVLKQRQSVLEEQTCQLLKDILLNSSVAEKL